jgi:hypothetical protein
MAMRTRMLAMILLALVSTSCTLPSFASPTPFTFPTPNLTHTAIFAITPSATSPPTTATPTEELTPTIEASTPSTPVATATGPTGTPLPSATMSSMSSRPNGSPITATFLSAPPTIDGDLSEWSTTAYKAEETVPYAGDNWTGVSDLSATFYLGWDANYLYIAISRTDDTIVQVSWGRYMYRGDDVEIQLDTDLAGDFHSAIMSSDDYQIGLSPGNFDSLESEAYRWYPRYLESWIRSAIVKAVITDDGYDLEAKIPWSVFDVTPRDGTRFGFALSLSDNDIAGTSSWQSMVSSVNTRRVTDPMTWGTLILEGSTGE